MSLCISCIFICEKFVFEDISQFLCIGGSDVRGNSFVIVVLFCID